MEDKTEDIRRAMVADLNSDPCTREGLEVIHGKGNVWDTDEVRAQFEVIGFMAPFVVVRRKSDGRKGSLMFQHHPRYYFGWQEDFGGK